MNELNPLQNPNPNKQKQKWVALSLTALFVVSGAIYGLAKHHRAQSQGQGGGSQSDNAQPTTATALRTNSGTPSTGGSVNTASTTGTVGTTATESKLAGPSAGNAPAQKAQADQCVTITYHHKPMAGHEDDEACSHHKNMLTLPALAGAAIAPQTVCVRVNGTPVHYLTVKGHTNELIFGAVAGPKSAVVVRYCTGKALGCTKQDCTIPKDEFMDAIGGDQGGSQNAKVGQWDPSASAAKEADVMARLDGSVKKELETNDDLNGRSPAGEIFKDWIGEPQAAACGSAQAKN